MSKPVKTEQTEASKRRMTQQERSAATSSALPQPQDPDDATLGFGPRSFDPERRTERLSYRDPEEVSQGPLRFDETNYSVERLTLSEGGYNEYADEYSSYRDEEGVSRMHYGPLTEDAWQRPQYANATQNDLLVDLPSSDISAPDEPDSPELSFRLSQEDEDGVRSDRLSIEESPLAYEIKKIPGFGKHASRMEGRSDEQIREDIYEVMDSRADIDALNIALHVKKGVVTIEGEVTDAMLRHRIEQCADNVDGVTDINNRLHLAAPHSRRL